MYAAAWHRDLHDSGLPGYLQTAERPGWALIACRIAPEYRVDDCAGLG
jgi:protein TonB